MDIRMHVARAMTKLAARDRAQLVVAAYESSLWPALTGPTPRSQPPGRPGRRP
jgi:hypothetical protein